MPDSIFEMSTPEKLNEVAIFLPRKNGYLGMDLVSSLESAVRLAFEYRLHDLLGLKHSELKRVLEIRKILVPKDRPLIDEDRSHYDDHSGSVFVFSRRKFKNGEDPYHKVDIENFVSIYANEEEKRRSFIDSMVRDPCIRVNQQCRFRIPERWINFYNTKYPSALQPIISVVDRHGFEAIGYATISFDREGFGGIYGITQSKLSVTRSFAKKQLRCKNRLDNYILGSVLTKTPLMDEIAKWTYKSYGFNLPSFI